MEHEFSLPRNIYEKLIRDHDRIKKVLDGDNLYNYILTANHLKEAFRNWPIDKNAVVARFEKRLSQNVSLSLCTQVARAEKGFKLIRREASWVVSIGEVEVEVEEFIDDILHTYEFYFK